jgi:hypothetical protein
MNLPACVSRFIRITKLLKKGLASIAEWRDHHPEILEAAEDIFYLEGEVTNFM